MIRKLVLFKFIFVASISASWVEAEPVALIEDINVQSSDFQIMDFVSPGMKIQLNTNESLVLGYLNSCIQESIDGGFVTVGDEKSVVVGGKVTRRQLTCGGNTKISATRNKKGDAGAVVFRNKNNAKRTKAEYEVYGVSPIIFLTANSDEVLITRLDGKGRIHNFSVEKNFVDLAKKGLKLRRNFIYRLEAGKRTTTFKVSAKARRKVPLLGRLLRF